MTIDKKAELRAKLDNDVAALSGYRYSNG